MVVIVMMVGKIMRFCDVELCDILVIFCFYNYVVCEIMVVWINWEDILDECIIWFEICKDVGWFVIVVVDELDSVLGFVSYGFF